MKKQILKMGVVASLVMGGLSTAYAGPAAQVQVQGVVTAASCDVSAPATVNVGAWTPASFADAITGFTGIAGVTASKSDFQAKLSNCTGTVADAGTMKLRVEGSTLADSSDEIFNDEVADTSGFILTQKTGTAAATAVKANEDFSVYTFATTTTPAHTAAAGDADDTLVDFSVYMAKMAADTPVVGAKKSSLSIVAVYE